MGQKAPFYLVMNTEPEGQNWAEVKYEEVVDNRPNVWHYGEGNWFEIMSSEKWRDPIDDPMLCLYSQGGALKKPWHGSFGKKIRDGSGDHAGTDLFAEPGTKVYACVKSKIVNIYTSSSMAGNTIITKILDVETFKNMRKNYSPLYPNKGELTDVNFNHNGPFYLVFFHLQKMDYFEEGDIVEGNDVIGLTGVSGGLDGKTFETCNPHLHFEVRNTKDYLRYLKQRCNPSMYFDFKSESELSQQK